MPICCRCPYCHDAGRRQNSASCKVCRGEPFVSVKQWEDAPKPMRDRVIRDLAVSEGSGEAA